MNIIRITLGVALIGLLTACSSNDNNIIGGQQSALSALLASGGSSTSGTGGTGGSVSIRSYGAVNVLKTGVLDAVFSIPSATPDFGSTPAVVSGGTITVLVDDDPNDGNSHLYTKNGDGSLYLGSGDGDATNDPAVTGLTVSAGATLVLADQGFGYATLRLTNDLVINGTLTTDVNSTTGLDIEANFIVVGSGGIMTTSATTMDSSAGEIWLGNGSHVTKQIINRGTIEANGLGTGSGGYLRFESDDLVANEGTIDASGGDSTVAGSSGGSGGSSGELDVYVDYGDFHSSGIVRVNGGKGATDGGANEADWCNYNCNSVYVETAYQDNTSGRNGDIIISGTWEANGGEGTNGAGGHGGYLYLQADAMGAVKINASMSVKGGDGSGSGSYSGAPTYGIDIRSYNYRTDPASPGKIRIAGHFDLRGGNGDESGGSGGYLQIYSDGYNGSNIGSDVELVGFATIDLNGGDGANGGSAASYAFQVNTNSPNGMPAGPITNEAAIEAKGGSAALTPGSYGGSGGNVEMITNGIGEPSEIIINTGAIDTSGGNCDMGGGSSMINLGAQHVTNSGNLSANGGNGATAGGSGGNIYVNSKDAATPTTNTGALIAAGGTPGGSAGSINIDTGGGPT